MDVETLSNRILDGDFDLFHTDNTYFDDQDTDNFLDHYGVKGMKWGIRKERESSGKKKKSSTVRATEKMTSLLRGKNRRYKDETAAQYQARMRRESNERIAKINAKQQTAAEKRTLKSQEKIAKMQIKAAKEQAAKEEAKQNPTTKVSPKKTVKTMSDQEIRDAIARFRLEQEYKNEQRKANDMTNGLMKKTVKGAAVVGGGILLAVGKQVLTKQLADIGNQNLDDYLVKKGYKKFSTASQKGGDKK